MSDEDDDKAPEATFVDMSTRWNRMANMWAIKEHATEEERRALPRMTEEEREGLAAICEQRSRDACEAKEAAYQLRVAREGRLGRLHRLHRGDFPARLIASAVGVQKATDVYIDDNDVVPARPMETAAMQQARQYLASDKTIFLPLGGTGTGKTTAAVWIAYNAPAVVDSKGDTCPVGYVRSTTLEADGRYSKERRAWLEKLGLLVIDDLGVEPLDGKGYYRALLEEIVDDYWGSGRRLIITSNLLASKQKPTDPDQIVERYGGRIWSRICEVGMVANCGAEDLRRARGN